VINHQLHTLNGQPTMEIDRLTLSLVLGRAERAIMQNPQKNLPLLLKIVEQTPIKHPQEAEASLKVRALLEASGESVSGSPTATHTRLSADYH